MSSTGLLDGYRATQLPNLSNNRHRNRNVHFLSHHAAFDEHLRSVRASDLNALILVAYANVLGMYCGVTDVLLSLEASDGTQVPCRLQWGETTTWLNLLDFASVSLTQTTSTAQSQKLASTSIPRPLDNSEQVDDFAQLPFIATFRDSSQAINYVGSTSARQPLLVHTRDGTLDLHSPSDFFCDSTASMLLRHVVAVMSQALADSTQKVVMPLRLNSDLASVVEALPEHEQPAYYSHIRLAHSATEYILPHLTSNPEATAVQWHPHLSPDTVVLRTPECLSYRDLDRSANRFARFLLSRGLCPEDRVAVCLDRDPMYHSVLFGILRAGGCYVPIDPELPIERKLFIMKDSSAKFVFISSQFRGYNYFGGLAIDVNDMTIQETILNMNDVELNLALPGNTAYMLYTSGTTGNPKGCLLTHDGLTQAILALSSFSADVKMTDIRGGRYLAIASIAFDVHLAEVFVPLALGMTLVSAKRGELLENLPLYINLLEITHVGLVPSLIDATMNAVEDDQTRKDMKLRYVASGGEKISDSILDKWADHPVVRLANFYGPSEVTIGCCARFMDGGTPRENIGPAFANVSSYVVDDNFNILPRGVVGELVVAGPLVGQGYHGLPDITAKSFMEWPHSGSWSYRTGDLVRMFPDGTLHVIGRIDTQIKLRGVRIEAEGVSAVFRRAALDELGLRLDIATVLAAHPSIMNGATPQLVTFIAWDTLVSITLRRTTKPHVVPLEDNVLHTLQVISERELASYMRPAHIIRLSWLPLNTNGKADDKALSIIFRETDLRHLIRTPLPHQDQSSSNGIQQKLISLVENQTGVSHIDSRTNLFAYGIDSLSLVKLASDIRQTFRVSISVADIMGAASISSLDNLIQTRGSLPRSTLSDFEALAPFSSQWLHEVQQDLPPQTEVVRVLPPFPIQEGVLYHSDNHQTSCVQHVAMSIRDSISLPQIRKAWEATMNKLDILRTVFHFGRQLVQVILAPTSCQLPWIEKRTPCTNAESFCTFFFAEAAPSLARQINNATSTIAPFRLVLFSTPNDQSHWLTLSIHHALFDGVSLPLILKFVEDELLGRPHPTACPPESLLEYMHGAKVDAGRQLWAAMFSGFDWTGSRLTTKHSSSQIRRGSKSLTMSLTALGELLVPHRVTMQSALTCAFALSLAKYIHHTDDVAFVVIRAGRLLPVDGVEQATSPTINLLPTRIHLGTQDFLQRVQEDISAAVAFEHFPLSQMQKWIPSGIVPFDTLFAVTVKDDTRYEVWDILRSELPEPDFPLSMEILLDKSNDALIIQAVYHDSESLAMGVTDVFNHFDSILLDILQEERSRVPPLVQVVRCKNSALHTPIVQLEGFAEEELETLDAGGLGLLKEIVSNFFGVQSQQLHPNMSLISLGLDSIKSVGLSRILRQRGFSTNAMDIMGNLTMSKLAGLCARSRGHVVQAEIDQTVLSLRKQREVIRASLDLSACRLSFDDEIEIFPVTALQAAMLSQTVASAGNLYFHRFILDLHLDTNLAILQSAWKRTVHDFDILRTTFHYVAELGFWVQALHSIATLDWQESISTPSRRLQHTLDELFLDLKPTHESALCRPPVHLRILRSDPVGLHLVLFMHHALYDGLSIPTLLSHVENIYQNQEVEHHAQFFDFIPRILFQQENATAYWIERLQNYCPTRISHNTSNSSKAIIASRMISVRRELLVQFVHDNAVTLQCLAQAAWAKYLSSLILLNDIVFGHVVSGRSFDNSENVVGPMLNTVPCRVQLTPDMRNRELLQSIHRANVSALPWQQVSLRFVQNKMQLQGLFNTLLLFQPRHHSVPSQLWTLRELEEFEAQIQYPLNIEFHEVENGFLVRMACQSQYMDAEKLTRALIEIDVLVNELLGHPDNPATSFSHPVANTQLADISGSDSRLTDATHIPPALLAVLASVANYPADKLSASQSLIGIGIDSITAISVSAKCKRAGLTVGVGDIVSSFTIGELAKKATKTTLIAAVPQPKSPYLQLTTDERHAIIGRFPERRRNLIASISVATEGMKWLVAAWQRSLGQRFHHVFAYQLGPDVLIEQLRVAWKALVVYHPILRSTFASAPGSTDLRVVTFTPDLVETDLYEECVAYDLDSRTLAEKMMGITMSPLPISAAQTKGFILTSTMTTNRFLLIRMHHFQYDAFSLRLLLEDLTSIYLGSSPRNTSDGHTFLAVYRPPLSNFSEQQLYWKSIMPMPFLPTFFPPLTTEKNASLARTLVTITSAIPGASELRKRAQATDLPLHCILLASWASVQGFHSSSDHAIFGLWHAGRTGSISNVLNLAIPCMNVVPICVPVLDNLLDVARIVQQDLHARTPLIQQSSLQNIDEWITGGKGLPLANVFVNVLERAREDRQDKRLFDFVEISHAIPTEPLAYEESEVIDQLPATRLIQDDVMVDIIINEELDAITMSIESNQMIMDTMLAEEIINEWAMRVKRCLSYVI